MVDRKEFGEKKTNQEKLIVELTPKLVEIAGTLDMKTAARIKNNILTNTKVRAVDRASSRHTLPSIHEDILEETLNSSQKWEKQCRDNFDSARDLNSDHPSAYQNELQKRLGKALSR